MDVEEKIFGPLSFKQFVLAAIFVILGNFAYSYLELKISLIIIVILIGIFIAIMRNSPKVVIDENYLKIKKANSKTPEEFQKWFMQKFSELESHIEIRKHKGLISDPKLDGALKLFSEWLNKEGKE